MATVGGRRERVRRGGYLTRREAVAARDALLYRSAEDRGVEAWTVDRWLRYWLTTRTSIRPSTLRSYTEHAERHLIPQLDRVRLGELTGRQVADMFHTLGSTDTGWGRPPAPATLHRIRATLRGALNAAIREGLIRTIRPGTSNCPPRDGHRPWCGPTTASPPGANTANDPPSQCGRSSNSSRSSSSLPTTGSTRCGG